MSELNREFAIVRERILAAFPMMSAGAVKHAMNMIAKEIRRGHCGDVYDVHVGSRPLSNDGYFHHFEVEASGVTVYVRVTVD